MRTVLFMFLAVYLLLLLSSCSTPPPTLIPPVSTKLLEIKVQLSEAPTTKYTDESGRDYYGVVVVGINFDMRPIAINLITWDEIFEYFGSFTRFHRVKPADATPDPESQWSSLIPLPDSFRDSAQIMFRLPLPDDLIGDPQRMRLLIFTRVSPDAPPTKITDTFTYHVVDTLGADIYSPENIDFYQSASFVSRDDETGDYLTPFANLPDTFYRGLDIERVEVRILTP